MNKLDMKSENIINDNIKYIKKKFPNVVVESENGYAIDFNALKQELSDIVVDDTKEKYQLTWPGKKEAIVTANTPTTKTLRPVKEKSVNFDTTENIYIEGDNLEALKILQESYLGKIKCIYIDPPYNTGNDFIYNDNFKKDSNQELIDSGQIDEEGNRLVANNQSNGRFHSDWLSMIYMRLKLSRNLLADDGMIFISIDDNEQDNLKKVCCEIFGEKNFIAQFVWNRKNGRQNDSKFVSVNTEYVICFAKNIEICSFNLLPRTEELNSSYKNPDNDPRGPWTTTKLDAKSGSKDSNYEYMFPNGVVWKPSVGRYYAYSTETLEKLYNDNRIWFGENGNNVPRVKKFLSEVKQGLVSNTLLLNTEVGTSQKAKEDYKKIIPEAEFDNPKPLDLIKLFLTLGTNNESIVLDFFSGSSTTAQAVLEFNKQYKKNVKFIMVQLPEKCNYDSEAYKNGYLSICDIAEERIRRAAKKIKEETNADIDYGFRVYKIDSSNMKDIYYKPSELNQEQLNMFETNIKEDRTSDDLLTQVILDLGLTLDLKFEEKNILNNKVYFVDKNSLVACFDDNLNINIIDEICKYNPLKVVFRDSSFKTDNDKINVEERIKKLSPETEINIL